MDEKILKEMIEEQKQIIERAQTQLNKLYSMAENLGIKVEKSNFMLAGSNSSLAEKIEEQRKQIMQRVNNLREQTMAQAKAALNSVSTNTKIPHMPQMPNLINQMPNLINQMPNASDIAKDLDLEDIKAKLEEAIELHKKDMSPEALNNLRKKLEEEK